MSEKQKINVLSLFDGISCGQIALERAGIAVDKYYASEIDKYAIQVTQKNYPNTIQLGDVTKIDFKQFEGKIDLLIGGSPCQDLSICGKRKGLSGDRSGLFYKYVEALNIIKPKWFLLENNVGMPQEAYEEISRLMGCYPIEINSALVSAQQRKRYYWTNIGDRNYNLFGFPTCAIPQPKDKGILLKDILESGEVYQDKSFCLTARYQGATFEHDLLRSQRSMVAEPVSYQLPRGNNIGGVKKNKVPTLISSQWQYNNLLMDIAEKNNNEMPSMFTLYNKSSVKDKSPVMTANSNSSLTHCGSVGVFKPIRLSEYEQSKGQAQRVYSVVGKTITLTAKGGGQGGKTGLYKIDLPDGDYIIGKLTPIECEKLQTLPIDYTQGISDTQRYKCIGNGWTVDVIAHILSYLPLDRV
jgi:DNA (cytosine-5)-methyltransferase 3A